MEQDILDEAGASSLGWAFGIGELGFVRDWELALRHGCMAPPRLGAHCHGAVWDP
jgi:hypothetical protein